MLSLPFYKICSFLIQTQFYPNPNIHVRHPTMQMYLHKYLVLFYNKCMFHRDYKGISVISDELSVILVSLDIQLDYF